MNKKYLKESLVESSNTGQNIVLSECVIFLATSNSLFLQSRKVMYNEVKRLIQSIYRLIGRVSTKKMNVFDFPILYLLSISLFKWNDLQDIESSKDWKKCKWIPHRLLVQYDPIPPHCPYFTCVPPAVLVGRC